MSFVMKSLPGLYCFDYFSADINSSKVKGESNFLLSTGKNKQKKIGWFDIVVSAI